MVSPLSSAESLSQNVTESSIESAPSVPVNFEFLQAISKVREAMKFDFDSLGINGTSLLTDCSPELRVFTPEGATQPTISGSSRGRQKSWLLNYTVISFLMNGQLFSEYHRISNMLGLPHCSD